jgi:hypothetical protein
MQKKASFFHKKLQRESRKKSILILGQWVSAAYRTGQPKPEMVLKHHVFRALASQAWPNLELAGHFANWPGFVLWP